MHGWLRAVGVGGRQGHPHVLHPEPLGLEEGRVHVDPDRRLRPSAHENLPDPAHLGELLLEEGRGDVVHPRPAVEIGRQAEQHDRRIGRVDLPVRRVVGEVRRELAAGGVDGGLDVAGGRVDAPGEVELEGDARRPERAGRRHLGHPGDPAELAL